MTWSWSHSHEAYADLQESIARQSREWLETVYAEWCAVEGGCQRPGYRTHENLNEHNYQRALVRAAALSTETLAERIYDWSEAHSSCSNGGWEADCCPFGCHLLAWDAYKHDWRAEFKDLYKKAIKAATGRTSFSGLELREARERAEDRLAPDYDAPCDETYVTRYLEET